MRLFTTTSKSREDGTTVFIVTAEIEYVVTDELLDLMPDAKQVISDDCLNRLIKELLAARNNGYRVYVK